MKEEQNLGWVVALLLGRTEPHAKKPPPCLAVHTATERELPLHRQDKDIMTASIKQECEADARRRR